MREGLAGRIGKLLECPACRGALEVHEDLVMCWNCGEAFPLIDDLVVLLTGDGLRAYLQSPLGKELEKRRPDRHPALSSDSSIAEIMEAARKLRDSAAGREALRDPADGALGAAVRRCLTLLRRAVRLDKADSILDLATGSGAFLESAAANLRKDAFVVATDVNTGRLLDTKYRLEGVLANPRLYVVCDVRRLPFRPGVFQAVTAWGGTTEFSDAAKVMADCRALLPAGGRIGIAGEQYGEGSGSLRIAAGLGLETLATRERLEACLKGCGYHGVEYAEVYKGRDADRPGTAVRDRPGTVVRDRWPLPAPGDRYSIAVAGGVAQGD